MSKSSYQKKIVHQGAIGSLIIFLLLSSSAFAEFERKVEKNGKTKTTIFIVDDIEIGREEIRKNKEIKLIGNIPDGVYREYDKNKRVQYEWAYNNGQLHGLSSEFYDGRRKKYEWTYKNGQRHGPSRYYSGYGILMWERVYENDILQGMTREYYTTGELKNEIAYHQDQKHGMAREYFKNGQLKSETIYEHKRRVRQTKLFNEEGVALLVR